MLCNQGLQRSIRLFNSCGPDPVIEAALKTDLLSRLIYLIQSHQFTVTMDPMSRAVIVNALKNIANFVSGSPGLTKQVLSSNLIELIVSLLTSQDLLFKNEAVFILGNMAADSGEIRDIILSANVVPMLIDIFAKEMAVGFVNEDLGQNAMWALKNFYNAEPALDLETATPIINAIFQLYGADQITPDFIPVCLEAVRVLRSVVAHNPTIVFGDFMHIFVKAVPFQSSEILTIIGDLVLQNDEYAIKFVQHGGLQMSISALDSIKDFNTRKEVFWILGNSCSASEIVSQEIIKVGLVPYAIAALSGPQPIANEAGWVVVETVKLCHQSPALATDFLNHGVIQGIFNLLCTALSPIGQLTENTILLITETLIAVYTLFKIEPDRVRCALFSVVPREDIDFRIDADQLFTCLIAMGHPIITNNASFLYKELKETNQPSQ